jgi:hypothetical protein
MMIFGFLPQNLKTKAVAVAFSTAWLRGEVGPRVEAARARDRLAVFRRELYRCLPRVRAHCFRRPMRCCARMGR